MKREFVGTRNGELFRPDEIWITSIMTYWWESTHELVQLIEHVFGQPTPRILVGGIYPTLFAEHADRSLRLRHNLRDEDLVIVEGEIAPEAANAWTDLSLYDDELYRHGLVTALSRAAAVVRSTVRIAPSSN